MKRNSKNQVMTEVVDETRNNVLLDEAHKVKLPEQTAPANGVDPLSEWKQLDQQRETIRAKLRTERERLANRLAEIDSALGTVAPLAPIVSPKAVNRKGSLTADDVLEYLKTHGETPKGQLQKGLKTWPIVLNSRLEELKDRITTRKDGLKVLISAK